MTLEEQAIAATRQGGTPPFTLLINLAREVDTLKENAMRPDPPAPNTENTGRTGKYRTLVPPGRPQKIQRGIKASLVVAGFGAAALVDIGLRLFA